LLNITANRTEHSEDNRAMLSGYSARGSNNSTNKWILLRRCSKLS